MKRFFGALLLGLLVVALWVWALNFRGEDEIHDAPVLSPVGSDGLAGGHLAQQSGSAPP